MCLIFLSYCDISCVFPSRDQFSSVLVLKVYKNMQIMQLALKFTCQSSAITWRVASQGLLENQTKTKQNISKQNISV